MSKNVIVNGQNYSGVNEVQLKTQDGGTANFRDVDEIASPAGTKTITANGTYDVADFATAEVNVSEGAAADTTAEDGLITGTITSYENDRVTTVASNPFRSCTTLSFPKVTKLTGSEFYYCSKVQSFNLPALTTMSGVDIFRGCSALTEITLPALTTLSGSRAFDSCKALVKADLGQVNTIYDYCFNGCDALETIILRRTSAICTLYSANATCIGSNVANGIGYVYVPAALLDTYKVDTKWANFADQLRAIEDYPDICG